jgi:hypothetical protein
MNLTKSYNWNIHQKVKSLAHHIATSGKSLAEPNFLKQTKAYSSR